MRFVCVYSKIVYMSVLLIPPNYEIFFFYFTNPRVDGGHVSKRDCSSAGSRISVYYQLISFS